MINGRKSKIVHATPQKDTFSTGAKEGGREEEEGKGKGRQRGREKMGEKGIKREEGRDRATCTWDLGCSFFMKNSWG